MRGRIAAPQSRRNSDLRAGARRTGRSQRRAGPARISPPKRARVAEADAVFIAVGTPSRRGDGHADLSFVYEAVREIAPLLPPNAVVVTKSTVPVGTGDEIEQHPARAAARRRSARSSPIPNFCARAPRSRISSIPTASWSAPTIARAREIVTDVYRPLYLNAAPMLYVSRRTAELIKYASNAFLATKITFINEMADLCEQVGADVQDVARGMGLDNRIGGKFLHAGPGLWRIVLSQGCDRAAQDRAGSRRPVAHRRNRFSGQRSAQARDGAQGGRRAGRFGARQDHRGARAFVQAEYRRHARIRRQSR